MTELVDFFDPDNPEHRESFLRVAEDEYVHELYRGGLFGEPPRRAEELFEHTLASFSGLPLDSLEDELRRRFEEAELRVAVGDESYHFYRPDGYRGV